jgi:trimeric autotransporter adhesin
MMLMSPLVAMGCMYGPNQPSGPYSVSGTAQGITGQGLLITDVGGSAVFVAKDGPFILENAFTDGSAYSVTAEADPSSSPAVKCRVTNGDGVVTGSDADGVSILCSPATFTIGGTVSGVDNAVGLILEARGEEIALSKDGTFIFQKPAATGSTYEVSIAQSPEGKTCTLTNSKGEIATTNVSDVSVTCRAVD